MRGIDKALSQIKDRLPCSDLDSSNIQQDQTFSSYTVICRDHPSLYVFSGRRSAVTPNRLHDHYPTGFDPWVMSVQSMIITQQDSIHG